MEPGMEDSLIQEVAETNVPFGTLSIWFIGQEGVIIKGGNTILCIDPYLSDHGNSLGLYRNYPTPILPQGLRNVDYYLISHDHLDHLDPDTVETVSDNNKKTMFIAPRYCHQQLRTLRVENQLLMAADTDLWIDQGDLRIKPIPAAHETLEKDSDLGHRFVGYIIHLNGVMIYHAGDTLIYPGLLERLMEEKVDIGMLPINGRDTFRFNRGAIGNMNYREAVEFAHLANFDLVIPFHYDMFADNSERPGNFVDYVHENFPTQKFHLMARGERFIFVK